MTTTAAVPPLSLDAVKQRYPKLFRQYTLLSIHEQESSQLIGDMGPGVAIDVKTGLRTTITMIDFTKLLGEKEGCPMKAASDANKFAMFLWNMLQATESGSVGGNACRQYSVLNAAAYDVLAMQSVAARFEHLLGWTTAVVHHQLHALLYGGDLDHNRSLFKAIGDAWQKVFEVNIEEFASRDLCCFAVRMCESIQILLGEVKKERGDYANYTFNFRKKPPAQNPISSATAAAGGAATAAKLVSNEQRSTNKVTILATKLSKNSNIGIGMQQKKNGVKVTSINAGSLFAASGLKVGMVLEAINGVKCTTTAAAIALFQAAEGRVTVAAAMPTNAVASTPVFAATTAASSSNAATNQKENFSPAKTNLDGDATHDHSKSWEMDIPVSKTTEGKQKSPSMIRSELQMFIDQCKADGTMTQTQIIQKMGIHNNTFTRFMDPKTYKDQRSAMQNRTYWAAVKLLAEAKYENKNAKKTGGGRKCVADGNTKSKKTMANAGRSNGGFPSKKTKREVDEFISHVNSVQGVSEDTVFDTCPQLVVKINTFLKRDGMTKTTLSKALENLDHKLLNRFLSGKGQDQCGTRAYKKAWAFFERLRILEGEKKSEARLKNESEHPLGLSLYKNRGGYFKYMS